MIVFLVEELSMYETLKGLLPRLFPGWVEKVDWQCVPHEGKSDLELSIPRKLKSWKTPGVRFVVLRDQDAADCIDVKGRLITLCTDGGRPDTLIRIPVPKLEAWFLGDLNAVEQGLKLNGIARLQVKAKFRDPDLLANAEDELEKLTGIPGKVIRARSIAPNMNVENNRSHSFGVFVTGLQRLVQN